jgi:hypothetical protein
MTGCPRCGAVQIGDGLKIERVEVVPDAELQEVALAAWSAALEELAEAKRRLHDLSEGGSSPWHWQGDGEDHLETFAEGSPILIRAGDLRRLISQRTAPCKP